MKTVEELISDAIVDQPLNILVFGPKPAPQAPDSRVRDLQEKRLAVRTALENLNHNVDFAEDVVDRTLPPPHDNLVLQELFLQQEYDLVVNVVHTPGTIGEAFMAAMKPDIAQKTQLFIAEDHLDGLAAQACNLASTFGADVNTFTYPGDIVDCHLLTMITIKVRALQIAKYLF